MARLFCSLVLALPLGITAISTAAGFTLPQEDDVAKAIEQLQDYRPLWRSWAAGNLARLGRAATPALPALARACADEDADVRAAAAKALGAIDGDLELRLPPLIVCLGDPEEPVWNAAASALGRIREPAKPTCLDAVDDPAKRSAALIALVRMGEAATPEVEVFFGREGLAPFVLMAWARGSSRKIPSILRGFDRPELEGDVWKALAWIGLHAPKRQRTVGRLVDPITDERRRGDVRFVLTGGQPNEAARPDQVEELLESEHAILRRIAVRALGFDIREARKGVALLAPMLEDEDEEVVLQALWALTQYDTRREGYGKEPTDSLELDDADWWWRRGSVIGIGGGAPGDIMPRTRWERLLSWCAGSYEFESEIPVVVPPENLQRAVAPVAVCLRSKSERVVEAALWTLYYLLPLEASSIEIVSQSLDHESPEIRSLGLHVARSFVVSGLHGWRGHARKSLDDPDPVVRRRATELLLLDAGTEAPGQLIELLRHEDPQLRLGAIRVLRSREDFGHRRYAEPLLQAFELGTLEAGGALCRQGKRATLLLVDLLSRSELDLEIRGMAIATLGWIGREAKLALPLLETFLDDPDEKIRLVTTNTITRITADGPW